jgi:GWxTD domain-containing protein
MRRIAACVIIALGLFAAPAGAATVVELFQKGKADFTAGRYAEALRSFDELRAEAARPENEKFRPQLAPALAFYRGATLAALGREAEARPEFETYLDLQPQATIEASAYPKKVVAAFEAVRKSRGKNAAAEGSFAAAYREFRAPAPIAESDSRWVEGPVQYLLTAREKAAFAAITDPNERNRFVEEFWRARDPRPQTPENEFRSEFERRAAFADSRFGQADKPGSLTDRGMIFILLGPPTYAGRKPLTTEDAAGPSLDTSGLLSTHLSQGARLPVKTALEGDANWREVWHYRQELLPRGVPYQQVDVEFVTKKGYGENVLQRDPATLTTIDAAKKPGEPRS